MIRISSFHQLALEHWRYEGTGWIGGYPHDAFCVGGRFHVMVSKDVFNAPGWHVSVRPYCSGPRKSYRTPSIPRHEWWPELEQLFKSAGVVFEELQTSPAEVTHFHEIVPTWKDA